MTDEPRTLITESGTRLVEQPDGRWAEIPPAGCSVCGLVWPWDGSVGWVLVGAHYGRRIYHCLRCGHVSGMGRAGLAEAPLGTADHGTTG